jgi:hypothetical protein
MPITDQNGSSIGAHIERDAGVLEHDAHTADVFTIKAGVERFLGRPAQVIGSEAHDEEHDDADDGKGRQAASTELKKAEPQSLDVLTARHR